MRARNAAAAEYVSRVMTRRDAGWVLRRCARRGHVLAILEDPEVQGKIGPLEQGPGPTPLVRCLRCGTWVPTTDVAVAELVGSDEAPASLADLPQAARGPHGRRFGLLRLVAVERFLRGLLMLVAGVAAFHVAETRSSILSYIERLAVAARPLGEELGVHITDSWLLLEAERYLSGSGSPVYLAGVGLLLSGCLQMIEGVGLWGGWRWAEYLAVVATSAFIPWELYEAVTDPTPLKLMALTLNILIVIYLIYKGRLFGVRGGHAKYLAELRDATLAAEILDGLGRGTEELSNPRVV